MHGHLNVWLCVNSLACTKNLSVLSRCMHDCMQETHQCVCMLANKFLSVSDAIQLEQCRRRACRRAYTSISRRTITCSMSVDSARCHQTCSDWAMTRSLAIVNRLCTCMSVAEQCRPAKRRCWGSKETINSPPPWAPMQNVHVITS